MANHTLVAVNSSISDTIILLMPFNLRVKRKCSLDEYQNHAHTQNNQFLIMRFYIIISIWSMDDCKSIFNGMKRDFFLKKHTRKKKTAIFARRFAWHHNVINIAMLLPYHWTHSEKVLFKVKYIWKIIMVMMLHEIYWNTYAILCI